MIEINLTLPYPPSVNHYWGEKAILSKKLSKRGKRKLMVIKYLSRRARDFRETVCEIVWEQFSGQPPRLRQRVQATVLDYDGQHTEAPLLHGKAQDIDACLKPLLDALEHAKVFINDEQVDALLVLKKRRAAVGRVEVKIETIGG